MEFRICSKEKILAVTMAIAIAISIFLGFPTSAYAYQTQVVDGTTFKISDNAHFATNESNVLFVSNQAYLPQIDGWTWQTAGNNVRLLGQTFTPYRPVDPSGVSVAVPNDCLKTAQIVSAMIKVNSIHNSNSSKINESYEGFPEPVEFYQAYRLRGAGASGSLQEAMGPGDAYLSVNSKSENEVVYGDFHTATVIAQDGSDNVTMEASAPETCSSSRNQYQLSPNNIIFDMYNETNKKQSFWSSQSVPSGKRVFKTSVKRKGSGLMCDILDGLGSSQKKKLRKQMGVQASS